MPTDAEIYAKLPSHKKDIWDGKTSHSPEVRAAFMARWRGDKSVRASSRDKGITDCIHLGGPHELGTIDCPTCPKGGKLRFKTFHCGIYGRCAARKLDGVPGHCTKNCPGYDNGDKEIEEQDTSVKSLEVVPPVPVPPELRMRAPGEHRKGVWLNGVLQIMVTRACDRSCNNCTQGSNLKGPVHFMPPEQFRIAVQSLKDYFGVVGIFGGNPCHARGTRVYTTTGIYPIEELEGLSFSVRNLRGEISPAICWKAGTGRQLYEIKLRGGHSHFTTADHEWPSLELKYGSNAKRKDRPDYNPRKTAAPLGKIKTKDLRPGMRLPILFADSLGFGSEGSIEDGFLAGWILGDGWIGKKHEPTQYIKNYRNQHASFPRLRTTTSVRVSGLIANAEDVASGVTNRISATLKTLGCGATWRAVKTCRELHIGNSGVDDWMDRFGIISKAEGLPSTTWTTASESFRKGLIDGLFSSDGNVEVSKKRGFVRVRLTSAHRKLAGDVSELLSFYGIKSQIEQRTRKGVFPNGKNYNREYTSYTLSISNTASVERFAKLFPLTHAGKNTRLQEAVGKHKTEDVDATNIEIVSVTPTDRYEDVWDISVGDDTHCYQIAHCVTGNCLHPQFDELCTILRGSIPWERRGLWSNHPRGMGKHAAITFNPAHSNLNVHQSREAYDEFARDWPECVPHLKGLESDSRHSPPFVAIKDVIPDEAERWKLIHECDINKNWSALIGVFRGELRGWFCEVAGAQAMLHQDEPDYPDTGLLITPGWWKRGREAFAHQVVKHCHDCGIPLKGHGALANGDEPSQFSVTHADIYRTRGGSVQQVTELIQLGSKLQRVTDYIENGAA